MSAALAPSSFDEFAASTRGYALSALSQSYSDQAHNEVGHLHLVIGHAERHVAHTENYLARAGRVVGVIREDAEAEATRLEMLAARLRRIAR